MTDLSPAPKFKAFVTGTSTPLAGGKLYTYLAGTSTPQATAKDKAGTPNTNPIILDANGECDLWLSDISYKYVLKDSADVTIWTTDNVATMLGAFNTAIAALTVETFAALATTPATTAGMTVYLKQHTSGGLGGGHFMDMAGTITNDGGTLINNTVTSGRHWARIDYSHAASEMFGAICDGVADDTAACALLVTYAINNAPAKIEYSVGTNKLTASHNINVPNDTEIVFNNIFTTTTTTGVAVTIGSSSSNTFRITADGGSGIYVHRSSIDFSGSSIGVQLRNLAFSKIRVKSVQGFNAGLFVKGDQPNGGFSYNDIYIGDLTDNKYNLFLTASGTGYCNENSFHGGSYGFSSAYAGHYAGAFNVYEDSFPSSRLNNNKFWGPSWETADYAVVAYQGYAENTHIYAPRLESANGTGVEFKIVFGTGSQCCVLIGGSGVNHGSITNDGTGNMWFSRQGLVINGIGTGTESCISAKSNVTNTNRIYQGLDTSHVERFLVQGDGLVGLTAQKYLSGSLGNSVGTFTLTSGAATVSNTTITANSLVSISLKTVGGTIDGKPYEVTKTPGSGFTVDGGGALNTSTYNYEIVEIA